MKKHLDISFQPNLAVFSSLQTSCYCLKPLLAAFFMPTRVLNVCLSVITLNCHFRVSKDVPSTN